MATSPRPGVITLEHPNVYMAAKEAQKDDWLRRGINLTGDIASQALTERNRDIRYRRAAGRDEDRRTNGEIASDLGSKAWGLLKAPFADDAPMAPTTSEDYRTEVGEKKTSPLAEGPSDIIDSPEQLLSAPKVTTEVDGLPSTQTAEPGVKVTFPTTVAGTVERSSMPSTVVPLPAKKAPETPQNAANDKVPEGMLRSPSWSEMYRVDPKRAEYDYALAKDAEYISLNRDKLTQEASSDAAKLAQKAGQASSLEELQQLWKDNTRALTEAKRIQDPVGTKLYQDNLDRLLPLLQEKAPAVWGQKKGGETTAPGGETVDTEEFSKRKASAKSEVATMLKSGVDADSDGNLDNFIALKAELDNIREKYNLSDADMAASNRLFDALVDQTSKVAKAKRDKLESDRAFALQQKSQSETGGAVDKRMAVNKLAALEENPSSEPARADAVLWIMRKNSGAMIGPNEILQYMQGKLPPEKYQQLTQELSPTGMKAILGLFTDKLDDSQITKITAQYIPYLDVDGVKSDLNVYANQKDSGGGGRKPPPGGSVIKTDAKGRQYTVDSNGKRNYIK